MVVAAAGNVDHAAVVRAGAQGLRARPAALDPDDAAPGRAARRPARRRAGAGGVELHAPARPSRPTSCSACPGCPRTDERRFALGVLNAALGGGMSSPAVPGGPREARAGLLGLLLHHAVRRHRPVRRLRRLPPEQGRRGARRCAAPSWPRSPPTGITAEELAPRQGPAARLARARPGGHRLADEPDRQGRAASTASCCRVDELLAPDRRGDPRRRARGRRRAARPRRRRSPSIGPFDDDRDFAAAVA